VKGEKKKKRREGKRKKKGERKNGMEKGEGRPGRIHLTQTAIKRQRLVNPNLEAQYNQPVSPAGKTVALNRKN